MNSGVPRTERVIKKARGPRSSASPRNAHPRYSTARPSTAPPSTNPPSVNPPLTNPPSINPPSITPPSAVSPSIVPPRTAHSTPSAKRTDSAPALTPDLSTRSSNGSPDPDMPLQSVESRHGSPASSAGGVMIPTLAQGRFTYSCPPPESRSNPNAISWSFRSSTSPFTPSKSRSNSAATWLPFGPAEGGEHRGSVDGLGLGFEGLKVSSASPEPGPWRPSDKHGGHRNGREQSSPPYTERGSTRLGSDGSYLFDRIGRSSSSLASSLVGDLRNFGISRETPETPNIANRFRPQSPQTPSAPGSSSRRQSVPAHNVADEELPEEKFHHPEFQQALATSQQAMRELARVLGCSNLHLNPESDIGRYYRRALELSKYQSPTTRTIGLVGDSGAGEHTCR